VTVNGVTVDYANSLAEEAGVVSGDVVLAINGTAIDAGSWEKTFTERLETLRDEYLPFTLRLRKGLRHQRRDDRDDLEESESSPSQSVECDDEDDDEDDDDTEVEPAKPAPFDWGSFSVLSLWWGGGFSGLSYFIHLYGDDSNTWLVPYTLGWSALGFVLAFFYAKRWCGMNPVAVDYDDSPV